MPEVRYKRILLKMGGEALAGPSGYGIDPQRAAEVAQVVKSVHDLGVEIALVIGAGNLWRGSVGAQAGMERSTADHIGMVATVMNALALQSADKTVLYVSPVIEALELALKPLVAALNATGNALLRLVGVRRQEERAATSAAGGGAC